jgi:nucleotide-binding universal stress UspA family protein
VNRILIATDGSPGGCEAVKQGLELAATTEARATIVYVRKPPFGIVGDAYYQRALTASFAPARKIIHDALAEAEAMDVDAEGEIMEGDAAEQIVELARSRDVDMIVVGSRALGPLAATLLGSVSNAVVHRARRPVLVVGADPDARRAAA